MSLRLDNIELPLAGFALNVNVVVNGPVTAVFGPSGAGKTSLLELILGLRPARRAFIQLETQVLTDTARGVFVPTRARGIGYVPQDLALFPHLSVRQNLLYGLRRNDRADMRFSFEHVVEVLEIQPLVGRAVTDLSGGEKQRVALARALLAAPRWLLLDEPLASLDAPLKAKLLPFLARLRDEFRIPMLCVTHDRMEALALADEVVVLLNGQVVQTGPVLDVFNRPATADVARIVGVETLQPGVVRHVQDGMASVVVGDATLTALAPAVATGRVLVCIRGEDVVLQRTGEVTSSVRNRLPARVVGVRTEGPLVRVELDAGFALFALVTRAACAELDLRPGALVVALIKAPAIHLVSRGDNC